MIVKEIDASIKIFSACNSKSFFGVWGLCHDRRSFKAPCFVTAVNLTEKVI